MERVLPVLQRKSKLMQIVSTGLIADEVIFGKEMSKIVKCVQKKTNTNVSGLWCEEKPLDSMKLRLVCFEHRKW